MAVGFGNFDADRVFDFGFYFLKTRKKGKAIAAIVLSILGLLMAVMAFSGKKSVDKTDQKTAVTTENSNLPNVFKDPTWVIPLIILKAGRRRNPIIFL